MPANKVELVDTGSSNPHHAYYDPQTKILVAVFKGDTMYAYPDVDQEEWDTLEAHFDGSQEKTAGQLFMATIAKRPSLRIN